MAELDIERLLTATARVTAYPPAPDLSVRVLRRLGLQRSDSSIRLRLPRLALAGLLIAVLAAVVAIAVEPSREAIARFFSIEGSRVQVLQTPAPGETPRPLPRQTTPGGELASLDQLAAALGFEPARPVVPQPLLTAELVRYGQQAVAVLHYDGFDLWQARLPQSAYFAKEVAANSERTETSVNGQPALWLSGAPHFVQYTSGAGSPVPGSERRVERSTLIWRTNYAFYRVETDLSLEDALTVAATLP